MDTLYTFWDSITHYKAESVHFLGLMNSATTFKVFYGPQVWRRTAPLGSGEVEEDDPKGPCT